MRSLISQKFSNLAIVGRCFSSDFEGQSAARIQPTCAGMGQAIGTAIYLAMENNCPLSIISREDIESQLSKITIV